ncbi:GAF domain-containing sensor histidine kinase [Aminipila sp.]|uniref:GAF domain-containing sensor histidine kinase n=1 Tax=Aminipila sp. TaxID=2060095 RepID=UPI00289BEB43|nr:GAF domain-containing sensor histidine kinase [Aminipila sp.]
MYDLNTIINICQTISSEIEVKKLLEKLMEIAMRNSGSTMGYILLKNDNRLVLASGKLNNNSELHINHKEIEFNPIDVKDLLPSSMINYVTMTNEVLIIDNISRSQFAYDQYFESNTVQSVMCLPIMKQNVLKGVVYLENNILSGAFDKNNMEVLNIIISQVAISIENAFLYAELENKVKEQTMQLEETVSKYKLKTEFFSNISHELRTPINVIISALQMHLLKLDGCHCKKISKACYKYHNIMRQNCFRLLRLANNLIDISKIDAGYFCVNSMNVNLVNVLENITMSVADYVEDKGIELIFDTDVEEKIIACDPEKIERILLNLLSNAVKFTPSGGNIRVDFRDGIENICISVKDNGRGIPQDKLGVIFKRFVQVNKSFTRDHEGSGIGLSLVKDLVELHGGTISVKSDTDQGAEFIISLPCKLLDKEYDEVDCCGELNKQHMDKINIEFSDI